MGDGGWRIGNSIVRLIIIWRIQYESRVPYILYIHHKSNQLSNSAHFICSLTIKACLSTKVVSGIRHSGTSGSISCAFCGFSVSPSSAPHA